MYNRLHDGPNHLPTGPRNYQAVPKAKPRASLAALQWATDRANQSYGVFTQGLTPEEEARIQAEYEAYKADREAAAEARRAERVEPPIPGGFIITDENA
jgi:hypothetical protein